MTTILQEFGPAIWIADGPTVPFLGFPYPTRMAVIRLSNGELLVWSPIAISDALRREVDARGAVRHLVSPNSIHHLFLGDWKSAYPRARLYAPPDLRKKRKDLAFDAELGGPSPPEWAAEIDHVLAHGSVIMTEVVFFHRASATAIFGDLIQNLAPDLFGGWRRWAARLDGIVSPHPGAPREWRASFVNRRAARAALDLIMAWPIERVVMAHGEPVIAHGKAFVRKAFAWLLGREARTG